MEELNKTLEEAVLDPFQIATIPVLPLRGMVISKGTTTHLDVGREKSVESVNRAMKTGRKIFLVAQKDPLISDPKFEDLYRVGTEGTIKQVMKLPNGIVRVLVEGEERALLSNLQENREYYEGSIDVLGDPLEDDEMELTALTRILIKEFSSFVDASNNLSGEIIAQISQQSNRQLTVNLIIENLSIAFEEKQNLLEINFLREKIERLLEIIIAEKSLMELEQEIGEKVKKSIDKSQREYYLREQLKVIKKELNEKIDYEKEIEDLKQRAKEGDYPKDVLERITKEIERLEMMPSNITEGSVIRTYIDWLLDLPWTKTTEESIDLKKVRDTLNKGHYGLFEPKERIIEYLAVKKLTGSLGKAPILCFVGPPGVGKTSLASSIGEAINRKFVRMSLGGVRDEAEIRGHRRTYVGALPGRLIQSMKLAGTKNPVLLLDEIDKLGSDYKGDPSSALLEALDTEQNKMFSDHYIEIPFDLSQVLFITTANSLRDIPDPLRDRMEIITLSSYTEKEKLEIAKKHLLPKKIKESGLEQYKITVTNKAFLTIINKYTREAGVRSLERALGRLLRKIAVDILDAKIDMSKGIKIDAPEVIGYLKNPKINDYKAKRKSEVGVVNGLAVTSLGGELLTLEGAMYKGKGKLMLTGQLGSVMQESVNAAMSYLREINIMKESLEDMGMDIHIHVPEGGIPKDGPSAGVGMATLLSSLLTDKKIDKNVAMTGEVTIRGHVLPIGGVKEKVLAAYKNGITKVILPVGNKGNVSDIPEDVLEKLDLVFVENIGEVLKEALVD